MPRYRIVVADVERAHAAHLQSYARGFRLSRNPEIQAQAERLAARHVGKPRPLGTLHDELEDACPLGRPNCRDCGDPDHAAACRKAGHCPDCGTKHGIAPASVLAVNGYRLVKVVEA